MDRINTSKAAANHANLQYRETESRLTNEVKQLNEQLRCQRAKFDADRKSLQAQRQNLVKAELAANSQIAEYNRCVTQSERALTEQKQRLKNGRLIASELLQGNNAMHSQIGNHSAIAHVQSVTDKAHPKFFPERMQNFAEAMLPPMLRNQNELKVVDVVKQIEYTLRDAVTVCNSMKKALEQFVTILCADDLQVRGHVVVTIEELMYTYWPRLVACHCDKASYYERGLCEVINEHRIVSTFMLRHNTFRPLAWNSIGTIVPFDEKVYAYQGTVPKYSLLSLPCKVIFPPLWDKNGLLLSKGFAVASYRN
ncbi:hypothetical protein SARC_07628 [Sphaeroforma arctica JP610]|uniref:Uncharacterized protein n=1 Tax=Sphaeroforma arctica JP610 TaxID=667725 RepID=A0A0L0FTT8_9EUKA|nr:hypothetical protein SARC_07628 [Sphaeroforma arctica JP610]KNC79996.1 hypothetical protein SARC_07628 [Sphaeroforma arctica JP610]|eukprot:XP_014153898.1 hypothetical protein SARC_07628 [Sphaeroforma arctica JP610]